MVAKKPIGGSGSREGVRLWFGGQAFVDRKAEIVVDEMSRPPKPAGERYKTPQRQLGRVSGEDWETLKDNLSKLKLDNLPEVALDLPLTWQHHHPKKSTTRI